MTTRTLDSIRAAALRSALLCLALIFAIPSLTHADAKATAASLGETVRLLESGKVGNVSDFCPHLRRELDRAEKQLASERRDLRHAIDNPPADGDRTGRITRGWANYISRRQRSLNATGRSLADLKRRIDRLCPPAVGALPGAGGARLAGAAAGTAAGLSAATLVTTPVAFAGGRLVGQVIDDAGQPVAGAPVTFGAADRLTGVVMTDPEGRFEIDVPEDGDEVRFSVLGLGATAASRLLTAGEKAGVIAPRPGTLLQPGDTLDLPGRVYLPWIEQEGRALDMPSSLYVTNPDDTDSVSTVRCPDALVPGDATLHYTDAAGSEQALPLGVYRVADSFIEKDLLRAGQSAGFGWTFELGAGAVGREVEVCTRVAGPVTLTGEPCRTTWADAAGQVRYASSIRAHAVTGEVPFSLDPLLDVQDVQDDGGSDDEETISARERRARQLEEDAQELRQDAETLEEEADRLEGTDPEGAAEKRLQAAGKHAEAEKKYRDAEDKYEDAAEGYRKDGDAGKAAEMDRKAEEMGGAAGSSGESNRGQRSAAAEGYRGVGEANPDTTRGSKASNRAAEIERDLATDAERRAAQAARGGDPAGAAEEYRRAAEHYDRAGDDFEDGHKASQSDGMKDRAKQANARAEQYERRARRAQDDR